MIVVNSTENGRRGVKTAPFLQSGADTPGDVCRWRLEVTEDFVKFLDRRYGNILV